MSIFVVAEGWDDKRMRSYEYIVSGRVGHVKYLEEGGPEDDEEEDA
jgi:hypothetical protein